VPIEQTERKLKFKKDRQRTKDAGQTKNKNMAAKRTKIAAADVSLRGDSTGRIRKLV